MVAMRRRPALPSDGPRVLVIGAGFGGLAAARSLSRARFRATLVDKNIYSTFQPLLYQVATAGLAPSDVAYPVRAFARRHGIRFRRGVLAAIDQRAQVVTLADGGRLGYDYLIIATGVTASYFGIEGAAKYSHALYTHRDAVLLRDILMEGLEQLSIGPEGESASVTVVGGGATGVEIAGTLAELRNFALTAAFPELDPARVQIRLVELGPQLIAPFAPSLRDYAYRQLRRRGVQVSLDTPIREVGPDSVTVGDGQSLPSNITIWAAGVAAPAQAADWGLPQGKQGRILVGRDFRVKGTDRIFAIGDICLVEDAPLPELAQPAIQAGRHAAAQIGRLVAGEQTEPFSYHDKGTMATIGRWSAVVQFPRRVKVTGALAWLAWLGLHLFELLGGRNRLSALMNLSWRYFTWRHGGGLIVGDQPSQEA